VASTAITPPTIAVAPPRRGFLAWYRRYYLLVNLPVLFLVTELALTRMDLVHRWPFNEKDDLVKSLAIYATRPPPADAKVMLLLGNSATDRGLDAPAIERAIGDPALRVYNFGLKGARLDDQFALLDLVFERGIKPSYVVLGVNTYLIDHQVVVDSTYPWLERRTPYVYFYRSRIRTKLWRWMKSLVGLEKHRLAKVLEGDVPDGRTPETAIQTFVDEFDHRPPSDYPMIDRLPELVDRLAARGVRTYVVLFPMAASGTSRIAEFDALLAAIKAKTPSDTLDLSHAPERFTDDLFYDVGHTNRAGRVALTAAVIPWLRQQLGHAPDPHAERR
jgi:hypothetical protein